MTLIERGESFYQPMMPGVVAELERKGPWCSTTKDTWKKSRFSGQVTVKADTHEGFCSRNMLQAHFSHVSTYEGLFSSSLNLPRVLASKYCLLPNWLNIVEHFAGWKFSSRGWSKPMKSLVHTEELCSRNVPLEHVPGAKSLVCIGL